MTLTAAGARLTWSDTVWSFPVHRTASATHNFERLRLQAFQQPARRSCPEVVAKIPWMSLRRPGFLCMFIAMPTSTTYTGTHAPATQRPHHLTRDEVMTAMEVAELLQLPVSTVYYLARRGEIPATRFGRAWRFLRPRIEEKPAG